MVQIQQRLLAAVLLLSGLLPTASARKFYPDDPVTEDCKPAPVGTVARREIAALYDFLQQSRRHHPRVSPPARGVNTLGDVPNSAWFTNRHAVRRMTAEQLAAGAGSSNPPLPPFEVVGAKTDGITPGFRMRDRRGQLYFVKPDPAGNPEMATAADVIGARFFYALGYFTPENYLVSIRRSELRVAPGTMTTGLANRQRRMSERDLDAILGGVPRRGDGTWRMLASLAVPGEPIGPFHYEGVRADDVNDVVPHEDRRDLRGLHVLCAWLNHTDAKAQNTLDTVVEENGVRFIRHHLIDFGAILGSDSDMPKNARFGNAYIVPTGRQALAGIFGLGLYSPAWERADFPHLRSVGRLEWEVFDPEKWKSNYPNPAFLSRRADDEYWAAKLVMAFTDDDIAAVVASGQYSDERATRYVTEALAKRRDKIGQTYFTKVLALDNVRVDGGALRFDDLAVQRGFAKPREYEVAWSSFDNIADRHSPLPGASGFQVPAAAPEAYIAARIAAKGEAGKAVTVYMQGSRVVGLDRSW